MTLQVWGYVSSSFFGDIKHCVFSWALSVVCICWIMSMGVTPTWVKCVHELKLNQVKLSLGGHHCLLIFLTWHIKVSFFMWRSWKMNVPPFHHMSQLWLWPSQNNSGRNSTTWFGHPPTRQNFDLVTLRWQCNHNPCKPWLCLKTRENMLVHGLVSVECIHSKWILW